MSVLQNDATSVRAHGVGNRSPADDLVRSINSRSIRIALRLVRPVAFMALHGGGARLALHTVDAWLWVRTVTGIGL
jgi:hypothetical protein